MRLDPIIFYILIVSVPMLSLALLAVVLAFERAHKKVEKVEGEENEVLVRTHAQALEILDDARRRSLQIIDAANTTAQTILQQSRQSRESYDEAFEKTLRETHAKLLQDMHPLFKSIAKDIEDAALLEVANFKDLLTQETIASQRFVSQKIEAAYQAMEGDLEKYRAEKLQKIDEQIYAFVMDVSKEILRKHIAVPDHEELVIKALEQAKKEGVFS